MYANVRGLAKTYQEAKTISKDGTLSSFIQGFNMEDVLCDFVDAGDGKECSDVKIRGKSMNPETSLMIENLTLGV